MAKDRLVQGTSRQFCADVFFRLLYELHPDHEFLTRASRGPALGVALFCKKHLLKEN
jgi:hypothetical protein